MNSKIKTQFENLKSLEEKFNFLIMLAGKAPSSHNTQPWSFENLYSKNKIIVQPNLERELNASDKTKRELYISLGAAISNIKIGANAMGFTCEQKILQQGKILSVEISLVEGFPADNTNEIIQNIWSRHTNRSFFTNKEVPRDFLNFIRDRTPEGIRVDFFEGEQLINEISDIVVKATEEAFKDKNFTLELSNWIKPSLKKYKLGMPGYYLGIPFPISFIVPLAIRYANVSKQQGKMIKDILMHSPLFTVISVKEDIVEYWLGAGEFYEKISIEAEARGIKVGTYAAAIEIGNYYKDLQRLTKSEFRPVIFSRMGYSDKVPTPSPRLDIKEILIK